MQIVHCNTNKFASAALHTGLLGASASSCSQHCFHLLFPICILCTIQSLNGSCIPLSISLSTTGTSQRTGHHGGKLVSAGFFLDGFLAEGQAAQSINVMKCSWQVTRHFPFPDQLALLNPVWYRGFATTVSWCLHPPELHQTVVFALLQLIGFVYAFSIFLLLTFLASEWSV